VGRLPKELLEPDGYLVPVGGIQLSNLLLVLPGEFRQRPAPLATQDDVNSPQRAPSCYQQGERDKSAISAEP